MDPVNNVPEIDVPGAKKALEKGDHLFLDVRDPASYAQAHVPGALHVDDQNVEEVVRTADKKKPVIVYCFHGINSVGAAAYFLSQGFGTVSSLQGGFEGWSQGGGETTPLLR